MRYLIQKKIKPEKRRVKVVYSTNWDKGISTSAKWVQDQNRWHYCGSVFLVVDAGENANRTFNAQLRSFRISAFTVFVLDKVQYLFQISFGIDQTTAGTLNDILPKWSKRLGEQVWNRQCMKKYCNYGWSYFDGYYRGSKYVNTGLGRLTLQVCRQK